METDLAEIFLILDAKREKYAESLILADIESVRAIQIKILHIDEMKRLLSAEIKSRRQKSWQAT
jgi:hypothetical protein